MYDLKAFTLADMSSCSAALRGLGSGASSNRVVRHLHDQFVDPSSGDRTCALVRFYKTHRYGELEGQLQAFADGLLDDQQASADMQCLTLLATAGEDPEWNSRKNSIGHKAIPLPSAEIVNQIPMIAQLVSQFGLDPSMLVKPDTSLVVDLEKETFNVFYVPEAVGSPYVPAQDDFVIPFRIRSVLGFGGLLPSGDLFAVIMFAKVPISQETAQMFEPLALSTKLSCLPFVGGNIFS